MAAKIWITGTGGLIGSLLAKNPPESFPGETPELIALTRGDLALDDFAAVERRFRSESPAWVLHLAGLTRSPACQADPALARRLNVDVTRHLAELAAGRLLFFSTDLVFDGRKGGYVESDPVNPLSVYSETKAEAERVVLAHPGNVVIRTSLNYGESPTRDRSFNEEMRRAVEGGARLRLFTDEYRCPIRARDTARFTWRLLAALAARRVDAGAVPPAEIFHLAGAERLSRWEIGQLLARVHPEFRGRLDPASLVEYRGAPRSPDTSLNVRKLEARTGSVLPRFSDGFGPESAGA